MSDEFDIEHFNHEQAQAVIDWAMSAGAMVMLMHNSPKHDNKSEAVERLDGFLNAIQIMMDNMPEVMETPCTLIATESLSFADREERAVEELRAELDGL